MTGESVKKGIYYMLNITQTFKDYILSRGTHFSPYPNIVVMTLSIIIMISMFTLFEKRDNGFKYMIGSCISIFTGGLFGCIYYYMVEPNKYMYKDMFIYTVHIMYYLPMMTTLLFYLLYVIDITGHDIKQAGQVIFPFHIYWLIALVTTQFTRLGYWIGPGKEIHESYFLDVYTFCFIYYVLVSEWMLMSSKHIMVPRIKDFTAIIFSIFVGINVLQSILKSDTLVNPSMMIPLIYFLLVFRQNTFNKRTGTMDWEAFEDAIDNAIRKGKDFSIGCLKIDRLDLMIRNQDGIKDIQKFCQAIGHRGIIYRLDTKTLAIINIKADAAKIEEEIKILYEKYGENYKGVILPWTDIIRTGRDFRFILEQEIRQTEDNSIRDIKPDEKYWKLQESRLIARRVLAEIAEKKDMDDGHVRVFCQPIYSLKDRKVLSAESLMRLYVPDYGYLFPQVFIPIAEEENCIHILSLIIFNKVCKYLSDNPSVDIMTVNFSVIELVKKDFVADIMNTVNKYGISPGRIGIEITESMMESNFGSLQKVAKRLKDAGFMILIDDFGTGYSNLSRTLDLPVTVVKFDRSLLLTSEKKSGKTTINGLVDIFRKMDIQTLCEGVEDEKEEDFCESASFDYLQGYRYSRPIPIENLGKIKERIESVKG